ncbi:MAG TPA: gamma-glutamyltransferase [Phycisphaerae bacterium]|jgi:gamma-glutamyltranspeptidase/glutathione hydrolase
MMVAADSYEASRAGLEILRAGGNAFDAAAAVSFALAVTRPESTGLGGGGFMIGYVAHDRSWVVSDFRETAPAAATPDMYLGGGAGPDDLPASEIGWRAVATAGLVAGRIDALRRYGTLDLQAVMAPATRLAREGFAVDRYYVSAVKEVAEKYRKHPDLKEACGYVWRVHLRAGDLPQVGDRLVQPELARLLERIASEGAAGFYDGPVAAAIEAQMQAHGGLLTRRDLAEYRVRVRQPLRATYRGYELILMPPPSSGGICIAETLNILEGFDLHGLLASDRPQALHLLIEALKHAFADRARWLGDEDFGPVPLKLLSSKTYAQELRRRIVPEHVAEPDSYGARQLPDDGGTSHFCVVDRWGNCVVSTETINTEFGSLTAIDEWGLMLNSEMDDFTTVPGAQNTFGLIQSDRNRVAAHKRPLSSMAPTIVLKNGEPVLLIGASGGPRIISSVLNVMLAVLDGDAPLVDAVAGPRVHHQWRPDEVNFDAKPAEQIAAGLQSRGQHLSPKYRTGDVQAIQIHAGRMVGVCDPRKGGRPAGE